MFSISPALRRIGIYTILSYIALVLVNNSGYKLENMWLIYVPIFVTVYVFSRWVDSKLPADSTKNQKTQNKENWSRRQLTEHKKNESLSNLALLLAILLPHLHFPERSKISKKNHHQTRALCNKKGRLQEQQNSLGCHRIKCCNNHSFLETAPNRP